MDAQSDFAGESGIKERSDECSCSAHISRSFRFALGAKGLLLLALSAIVLAIANLAELLAFRGVGAAIAIFLAWASSLALVDAMHGEAIRESGAKLLASGRRFPRRVEAGSCKEQAES